MAAPSMMVSSCRSITHLSSLRTGIVSKLRWSIVVADSVGEETKDEILYGVLSFGTQTAKRFAALPRTIPISTSRSTT